MSEAESDPARPNKPAAPLDAPSIAVHPRRQELVIWLAVGGHLLVLGVLWLLIWDRFLGPGFPADQKNGMAIAEISLASIYLANSRRWQLAWRVPLTMLVIVGAAIYMVGFDERMASMFSMLFILQSLSIAAPLFVLATLGRRIVVPQPGQELRPGLRFTIGHIVVWTMTVACLLVASRALLRSLDAVEVGPRNMAVVALYLSLTFGGLTLMALWATLGESRVIVRTGILLGMCALASWGYLWANPAYDNFAEIFSILMTMSVVLALTLLAFRAAGYRLVRIGPAGTMPQSQDLTHSQDLTEPVQRSPLGGPLGSPAG